MYNQIPGEGTSKRVIVVMLLCCVALVSALATAYFAWLLDQQRVDDVVLEEVVDADDQVPVVEDVEEDPEVLAPVFAYPVAVQVPAPTEESEGLTYLSRALRDWYMANRETGLCINAREYATSGKVTQYDTSVQNALFDEGIRAAVVSYFQVSAEQEEAFFDGITLATDADDRLALGYTMCSGNERTFLLLEETKTAEEAQSDAVVPWAGSGAFPLVLEWIQNSSGGYEWVVYEGGYRALDGYTLYSDWNGKVILGTGYGDAGYANWEYQLLEVSGVTPVTTLLEKCTLEPTEDYEDSILTCEFQYTP